MSMMKQTLTMLLALTILLALTSAGVAERPNILIVLVDDMGFSDVGC